MIDQYDDLRKSKMSWESGLDVFEWWIEKYKHEIKGQMNFSDFLKETY
jgi:hypothetical protein